MLWDSLAVLIGSYVIWRCLYFRFYYLPKVRPVPGMTSIILPGHALSFIAPEIWPLNVPFYSGTGQKAFSKHAEAATTIVRRSAVLIPAQTTSTFFVADADAVQEMISKPDLFPKPIEMYKVLDLYGHNLVTSDGAHHRRHRKIVAPSFSESNNALVFEETLRTMLDWQANVAPKSGDVVEDKEVAATAKQLTLTIITAALFGTRSSWAESVDATPPPHHQVAFRSALQAVLENLVFRVLTPELVYKLPLLPTSLRSKLDRVDLLFKETEQYFQEFIKERRSDKGGVGDESVTRGRDLFGLLLAAKDADKESRTLSDRELIGNLFIFLVAGHETSAHTFSFALGLLALYPEKQDKLYQETKKVWPESGMPGYEDCNSFTYAQCVLYETLRRYAPVAYIPKVARGDQILTRVNLDDPSRSIPTLIPDGSYCGIDTLALHHNPLYWDNPLDFTPERFIDTPEKRWPRNAFCPFSLGGRSCIAQRFAQVEVICMLAFISIHFKIRIPPKYERKSGESLLQHEARVLVTEDKLTLTPKHLSLLFERR